MYQCKIDDNGTLFPRLLRWLCEIIILWNSLVLSRQGGRAVTVKMSARAGIRAQFAWQQFKSLSTMIFTRSRARRRYRQWFHLSLKNYTGSGGVMSFLWSLPWSGNTTPAIYRMSIYKSFRQVPELWVLGVLAGESSSAAFQWKQTQRRLCFQASTPRGWTLFRWRQKSNTALMSKEIRLFLLPQQQWNDPFIFIDPKRVSWVQTAKEHTKAIIL